MLIFHGVVDAERDGPLEAVLPCPPEIQPDDIVGVRTEPSHEEAYTTITKAQWDYPVILAAYDAVACSLDVTSRPAVRSTSSSQTTSDLTTSFAMSPSPSATRAQTPPTALGSWSLRWRTESAFWRTPLHVFA